MVVEYKGEHLYDANDAKKNPLVGQSENRGVGGKCMFAIPTEWEFPGITKAMNLRLPLS